MTTKSCHHNTCSAQPSSLDSCLDSPPTRRNPSLESLPNELVDKIFSYLIPQEILKTHARSPQDHQTTPEMKDEKELSWRLHPWTITPPNPLSIMSTNFHFYQICRQHPLLSCRIYSAKVTADGIEFEGHRYRALERLQANMFHIESLHLAFNVGNWGDDMDDGELDKFLHNYEKLFHAFDHSRMDKDKFRFRVNVQGRVPYDGVGKVTVPHCLRAFSDQLSKALLSGEEGDLEDVMWWGEEEGWGIEESEDVQKPSQLDLMRLVRTREIAASLRMMASLLYKE